MRGVARVLALGVVAAAVTACSEHVDVSRRDSAHAEWLAGLWDARFQIAGQTDARSAAPENVQGRIALFPNHSLTASYEGIGTPTAYGTYDLDFTPLGIEPRARDETPTVVAGWRGQDSVVLVLTTGSPSLSVTLRGEAVGDSIAGRWSYTLSRVSGGEGSFALRRVHATP